MNVNECKDDKMKINRKLKPCGHDNNGHLYVVCHLFSVPVVLRHLVEDLDNDRTFFFTNLKIIV